MNPDQKAEAIAELDQIRAFAVSISHEAFEGLDPLVRGALTCAFKDVRTVTYMWAHNVDAQAVSNARVWICSELQESRSAGDY